MSDKLKNLIPSPGIKPTTFRVVAKLHKDETFREYAFGAEDFEMIHFPLEHKGP
jgi:hypothetical protein